MDKKKFAEPSVDPDRREFVAGAAGLIAGIMTSRSARAAEPAEEPLAAPSTQKNTVLITGANRGLGFEFTQQYSERGWRIIATCRNPDKAEQLNALAADNPEILVERIDVVDHQSIDALAIKYQNMPIDVLLNNAGIGGGQENQLFGKLNYETYPQVIAVNCTGPIKMAEAFLEHVKAGTQKKIITVSSSQGSIAEVNMPMLYWYRSSKSAVNMLMTNLALQLKRRGVIVGLVTPGATATDFISPEFRKRIPGIREPAVAAADMIRNIDRFTLENTGTFFNYDGGIVPW